MTFEILFAGTNSLMGKDSVKISDEKEIKGGISGTVNLNLRSVRKDGQKAFLIDFTMKFSFTKDAGAVVRSSNGGQENWNPK